MQSSEKEREEIEALKRREKEREENFDNKLREMQEKHDLQLKSLEELHVKEMDGIKEKMRMLINFNEELIASNRVLQEKVQAQLDDTSEAEKISNYKLVFE